MSFPRIRLLTAAVICSWLLGPKGGGHRTGLLWFECRHALDYPDAYLMQVEKSTAKRKTGLPGEPCRGVDGGTVVYPWVGGVLTALDDGGAVREVLLRGLLIGYRW